MPTDERGAPVAGGAVLAVDIGGTFTDAVLTHGAAVHRTKVLTTPDDPARGFATATADVLRSSQVAPSAVERVVHGTTLATNVILERRGTPLALVTTAGYRSLLALGRHGRVEEERYDLWGPAPEPIVPLTHTFEVRERLAADGSVLVPLDADDLARVVAAVGALDVTSVAVCLVNSYASAVHEQRVADALRAGLGPAVRVVTSHDTLPEMREYERLTTTVVSAYVSPVMSRYLDALRSSLADLGIDAPLHVMESAGGVMPAALAARNPVHTVESGPAAGVVAAGRVGLDCGIGDVIAFDMGGTTAKAALVRGGHATLAHDFVVGGKGSFGGRRAGSGVPVTIPAIDLAEVGSGGGSIAWLDAAGSLRVGPRSAGATPGPACYGLGGAEPTVSDADLVLGYLAADRFAGGRMALDPTAAHDAVRTRVAEPLGLAVEEAAFTVHDIANADMAAAIHVVTVQRGIDPRGFALVATGGAAGMHACRIAARFDIATVIVPPFAGVGSCVGLARTDLLTQRSRTAVVDVAGADPDALTALYDGLAEAAIADLSLDPAQATVVRTVGARFVGQAHEIDTAVPAGALDHDALATLVADFRAAYARVFGLDVALPVQLVNHRVQVRAGVDDPLAGLRPGPAAAARPTVVRDAWFPETGGFAPTPRHDRAGLAPQARVAGPCLVVDDDATVVVPPGWSGTVDDRGALVLRATPVEDAPGDTAPSTSGAAR